MTENRVAAVDRALSLLGCFDAEHDRLTLKQLAERTGLYKSTILRLAGSLEASGYLNRLGDGSFSLGPTLWRLGSIYSKRFNFAETIRPVLRMLSEITHESASFYIRDGETRVCLFRQNGPQSIRHHLDEGAQLPIDQGAAGHLIRAYTDGGGDHAHDIIETGHAVSLGERDLDTASIAVPVFGADKKFLGAVVVSGLRSRFDETARTHAIKAALAEARDLGPKLIQP
jgi:DNA-binding IclR family transcriptional regulator